MTHEDEELQHDLSKLQEQVQRISHSQRATKNEIEVLKKGVEVKMDGLKKGMEAKMDGVEASMEAKMDGMEENMENMKNDLKAYIKGLTK